MLFDWFTIGAQVVNFLVLVWLMKRFLYQPILDAIGAREQLIAGELADASAKKAESEKERNEFQQKNAQFDRERAALMTGAAASAKTEQQRLMDEARKAADALAVDRQKALLSEARDTNQAFSRRTQEEVFAVARKTLADLATVSLEERIAAVFIRRLRDMGDIAKAQIRDALREASNTALVRSAFELPAAERAAIQDAINRAFSADVHVQFATAPEVIGGIELTAGGQRVSWTIADYLVSLEKTVNEVLAPGAKA